LLLDVKVPVLAESIAEAALLSWQKQPGDVVKRGEHLIEIETDKVVLEVPAPGDGVLKEILKGDGETVHSDELLARIDTTNIPQELTAAPVSALDIRGEAATEKPSTEPLLSPSVRRLVAEHQLDPSKIPPTGRGGRITKADVLSHLESQKESPPGAGAVGTPETPVEVPAEPTPRPGTPARSMTEGERAERREPMSRLRARIAERLVEAQQTAAILTTFNEVDMGPVQALRKRYRDHFEKGHGVRLGFMSFFARASVLALQRFPLVNAYIDGKDIVYHDYYDLGIAVSSPRGLVVPILRDADNMSFAEVEQSITDVAVRARDGRLSPDELVGGTFTITNGGIFGSLLSTPILNPPQSAILGMHKIQERPVAIDGQVVVRPMMYLALSYDHRIIDGRAAVQFLVSVKEALEDPARMLLEI